MKTRTYTRNLVVEETPVTKESLKKALVSYKPTSIKDFIVICMLHGTAESALKRGWFNEPGTYSITEIWFSKDAPFHKVICRVRKIS